MNIPSYSPTINKKVYDNIFSILESNVLSKNMIKINNPKKLLVPKQILSNC